MVTPDIISCTARRLRDSASTPGGQQQNRTCDSVLDPGAVAHQAHAVLDDRDHRAAEHGVQHPALAAEQARPADDGGADRSSSTLLPPVLGSTELAREAAMMPPTAAMAEQMTNAEIRIRSTLMPARRAASALPPTA